jgi:sec-independent protein translocase protein TatA
MGLDNPLHIAFLVVILLLVFGARRLPEIGRSLGSGMREFKDSVTGDSKPAATLNAPQQPAQPQPPVTQPQPPAVQPPPPAAAQPPSAAQPGPQPANVGGSDQSAPPGTQTPGPA